MEPQPEPSHRIRICASPACWSNGVNFGYLRPMHTKPKRILDGVLFPYTFEQIRQYCATDFNNRIRPINKEKTEIEN